MYSETQPAQNLPLRCLLVGSTVLGLCQLPLMVAAEAGSFHLPLGYAGHLCLLLACGLAALLLGQAKLSLRIHRKGLSLRFFPYKWRWQHIGWHEIRQVRLVAPGKLPPGAFWGVPGRDFLHLYWLARAEHDVLQIELINGAQLYLSSRHPVTVMRFLEQGTKSMFGFSSPG